MALVVFTGGARCGKSRAAVNLALTRERLGYNVTFAAFGDTGAGADAMRMIEKSRRERPDSFTTIEAYDDPDWLEKVPKDDVLIVDCLDGYLGGLIRRSEETCGTAWDPIADSGEAEVIRLFRDFLNEITRRQGDTIVVTNEVGGGLEPVRGSDRFFRDLLGLANRSLVERADSSYYVVCGRLIDLESLPMTPSWPED